MPQQTPPLPPNAVIGIVGGGQLGRMSALAAARLGYRTHILTQEADGPAAQVAADVTVGGYDDPAALRAFAERVDVVSFEFENISAKGLDLLESLKPVRPSAEVLRISQDRVAEKTFLNQAGVPTAPWRAVQTLEDLENAVKSIGLPVVLKTTRLGYDGKGQVVLRTPEDLAPAFQALSGPPLVLEGFIDFSVELSVVLARGVDGSIACFDAVENRHHNGILDLTLAPARIQPDIAAAAQQAARKVAEAINLVGLLCVEMFLAADGRILANEIAPRPHNSGHWTMDACAMSQFEAHIRAVAGLPLIPAVRHSDAVMKNLVGPEEMALWPQIVATPGLIPHHYGKAEARPGRKMGHVNRLFPKDALPSDTGIIQALGVAVPRSG